MKRRRRKHDIGKEYNRPAPAGSDTGEWEGFDGLSIFSPPIQFKFISETEL